MQEQPDVDPRLQADHPERARGVAGASDLRAARLSRRESDGGVTGLYRGTEGVLRKATAEMGRQINFTVMAGLVRLVPAIHVLCLKEERRGCPSQGWAGRR